MFTSQDVPMSDLSEEITKADVVCAFTLIPVADTVRFIENQA
jgi:hypothetical protein